MSKTLTLDLRQSSVLLSLLIGVLLIVEQSLGGIFR